MNCPINNFVNDNGINGIIPSVIAPSVFAPVSAPRLKQTRVLRLFKTELVGRCFCDGKKILFAFFTKLTLSMAMYNKASYCSHLPLVEISLVYYKNILVPLQFLINKLVCFSSKGFTALSII